MDKQLFRQKSMDHISSPEELHDYMRVTSPRLWMLLSAIIVLLVGFIIYASTAKMENTLPIRVTVTAYDNGEPTDGSDTSGRDTLFFCALPYSMKEAVSTGMTVRLGSERGHVDLMSIVNDSEDSEAVMLIITMDNPNYSLPNGEYDADIILESTTPISFLWN